MALDPCSTAQLVAWLTERADDRQFVLESADTFWRLAPGRFPAALSLAPAAGERALMVAYAMLYRRQTFRGCMVVGRAYLTIAQGLLAQDARFQVQLYDLRNPVTPYTPGGRGVVGGP
jgi:hypothetical protein